MSVASFVPVLLRSQLFEKPAIPTTDCTGKTIIVTGSNVGLGKEAVAHFLQLNAAKVIIACRSVDKGEAARAELETRTGRKGALEVWQLDLQDYDSIRKFVKRAADLPRLDIFLANAGISPQEYKVVNGYESTIGTNVVSTFLLAFLILPKLQQVAQTFGIVPNLTIVASDVHYVAQFSERKSDNIFQALNAPCKDMQGRYCTSKLLQIYAVRELSKKNPVDKLHVTVNCLTPGWCHSELMRDLNSKPADFMKRLLARTTEVGSRTLLDAALKGPETHGAYLHDCKIRKPAPLVTGPEGPQIQSRFYGELIREIEKIQPGVTRPYDS